MAQDLTLRPAGLITDPSPLSSVPDGALREAKNVEIKRDGQIQPRPGFQDDISGLTTPSGNNSFYSIPFDGGYFVFGKDGSTWEMHKSADLGTITAQAEPPDPDRRRTKSMEARGSFYFTSNRGIRKLTSASDTADESAGISSVPNFDVTTSSASITSDWLEATVNVAYRCVIRRKDPNNYIIRSAPTGRVDYNPALDETPMLRFNAYVGGTAGDVIEVYRSRGAAGSGTPDDEMFLTVTHTVVAGNLTSEFTVTDDTGEDGLGAALYTNPSQGGIESGYEPPPYAHDVAFFRGHAFYADTKRLHRLVTKVLGDVGVNPAAPRRACCDCYRKCVRDYAVPFPPPPTTPFFRQANTSPMVPSPTGTPPTVPLHPPVYRSRPSTVAPTPSCSMIRVW